MIHPDTLSFLRSLKANNNREWFQENREKFNEAKNDLETLAGKLIEKIAVFDPDIAELEPARTLFRQYRDIRFSSDKTPYKIHMGAFFNRGGKHINNAGYYLHVEPGRSLYAAGFWMPESKDLAAIRQEIDYNLDEWIELISSPGVLKYFPSGIDMTERLKRPPKGYDKDNPALKYLQLKSFTLSTPVGDETLTGRGFGEMLINAYKAASPMVKFLNRAIE